MILVAVVVFVAMLFPNQAYADRIPQSVTVNTALPTWGGINITVEVSTTGSSSDNDWQSTSYTYGDPLNPATVWLCMDHENFEIGANTYDTSFDITTPIASGTYTLSLRVHENDACSVGTVSVPANMVDPITVAENNPAFPLACGINLTFVLDESGSIAGAGGVTPVGDEVRAAADTLWQTLEGTDSTMSIVEFNTQGRMVPTVQELAVLPANKAAFTAYISPTNPAGVTPSAATYAPEAEGDPDWFTNWEAAFIAVGDLSGDPKELLIFLTDGVPTTNNDFPNFEDPKNNYTEAAGTRQRHLGPAAVRANLIKSAGTRVLGLGFPNPSDPTLEMPYLSGPTQFISGTTTIAESDFAAVDNVDDFALALVTEFCKASITVNKFVNDPDSVETNPDLADYILADGWEFSAAASPTGGAFGWLEPSVSPSTTITGVTGGGNVTGTLTFQWEPETDTSLTTVTITETAQPGYEFFDVTCRDQRTGDIIVGPQTTLPVVVDVEYYEFVVCAFRNFRDPTAITLEQVGVGTSQSNWIFVAVAALAVFTAGVIVVLRRKESQTI